MHELSLCESIHAIVDRAREGRPVQSVQVRLGQLRQVVPDTLEVCWSMLTESGPLAGSSLQIEHVPVVLDCRRCGRRSTVVEPPLLACSSCGSRHVSLVSGEEFLVVSLELVEEGV
jgi:hydrogenase nickel incorporation protein HypA/HybF